MIPGTSCHVAVVQFSADECGRPWAPHERCPEGQDFFRPRDLAQVRFMRWISHSQPWYDATGGFEDGFQSSYLRRAGVSGATLPGTWCPVQIEG